MAGPWEFIYLLIVLFIVLGARRLPAWGTAIGRALSRNKTDEPSTEADGNQS
ncbi:MAG: twin-arginine translocase TatA/TatE family subunit [Deltaproteobacteria bacterium]|nr:twin-arginine translocase TatA/TatE family subunit [Deltaproteobacteria bacterium]